MSASTPAVPPKTAASDRLRYVLDGLSFPVDRWELIARAEHYGADATTLHELRALPARRYWSLTDVINAIAEDRYRLPLGRRRPVTSRTGPPGRPPGGC